MSRLFMIILLCLVAAVSIVLVSGRRGGRISREEKLAVRTVRRQAKQVDRLRRQLEEYSKNLDGVNRRVDLVISALGFVSPDVEVRDQTKLQGAISLWVGKKEGGGKDESVN